MSFRIKNSISRNVQGSYDRKEGELKAYYMRKVEEGKNKMSVINALRAKIVARMFAVIKRNEFYTPIYS